ncbi:hypothetical protein O3P69_002239 [Scylla paramamosain]|uniref:Uncharacterized protein n=1 Tax=Scylla paramamosain TaxID=85552 RepID=A0AAW0V6N0_SCYPA
MLMSIRRVDRTAVENATTNNNNKNKSDEEKNKGADDLSQRMVGAVHYPRDYKKRQNGLQNKILYQIDRRIDVGADITFDDLASKNKNTNLRRFIHSGDSSAGFEKRGLSFLANPIQCR